MYPFLNCSEINSCTSSLSSLDSRYTFSFFGANFSFILITWFYNFLIGILSLVFLPKTWIYLWNLSGTSYFASFFDFAASSFSSQISHSSTIFFTSIILSFLDFSFSFSFCSFFSCFFFSSSFFSLSFCFSQPDFPCFDLYCFSQSSRHLVIFTSLVLQLILGL